MHKLHAIDPVCAYLVTRFAVRPRAALALAAETAASRGERDGLDAAPELREIGLLPLLAAGVRYVLQLAVWGLVAHALQVFAHFVRERQRREFEVMTLARARRLAGRVARIIDLPASAAVEVRA